MIKNNTRYNRLVDSSLFPLSMIWYLGSILLKTLIKSRQIHYFIMNKQLWAISLMKAYYLS